LQKYFVAALQKVFRGKCLICLNVASSYGLDNGLNIYQNKYRKTTFLTYHAYPT